MPTEKFLSPEESALEWLNDDTQLATAQKLQAGGATRAFSRAFFSGTNESNPNASGSDIYTDPKNLPIATASILQRSISRVPFYPYSQGPETLAGNFQNYLQQFDSNPFLYLIKNDAIPGRYSNNDYAKLTATFMSLFTDYNSQDRDKIESAFLNMLFHLPAERVNDHFSAIFSLTTIRNKDNQDVEVSVYYTSLSITEGSPLGPQLDNDQNYTINRVVFGLSTNLIKTTASALASTTKVNVDEWIAKLTSPDH